MEEIIAKMSFLLQKYDRLIVYSEPEMGDFFNGMETSSEIFLYGMQGKELEDFLSLYYLYHFSDKIEYVSDSLNYPTLTNYLETGIISRDDYYAVIYAGMSREI